MKESIKLYFSTLKLSFKISFCASPIIMLVRMLTLVAGAIIPLINARAMKSIIDAATIADITVAVKWLIVLSVCQILSAVIVKVAKSLYPFNTFRSAQTGQETPLTRALITAFHSLPHTLHFHQTFFVDFSLTWSGRSG